MDYFSVTDTHTPLCRFAIWNSSDDRYLPDESPSRVAKPRGRRPVGNPRPPSSLNQQMQLPHTGSSFDPASQTSNAFSFGQQTNGVSSSASFPPFGGSSNNANVNGTNSSFNVPQSESFSFNFGQPAQVNNPFASLSTSTPQKQNPSTNQPTSSIFSFNHPSQSTSSIFSQAAQPNGVGHGPEGTSKNIFGSTALAPSQSADNKGSANLFEQPSAVQQQQTSLFNQKPSDGNPGNQSNPFGGSTIQNGTEPSKPQSSNIFGSFQQQSTGSSTSSNPFALKAAEKPQEATTNIFGLSSASGSAPSSNLFGQQSNSASQQASSSNNLFGKQSGPSTQQPSQTSNIFGQSAKSTTPSASSNNLFGPQSNTPAQPAWAPKTNLWGEMGGKTSPVAQLQENADASMMGMSPENSPEKQKQASSDSRPFSFLSPGSTPAPSTPTKSSDGPLGRSIFDRAATPAQSDSKPPDSNAGPGGLFGRVSAPTSQPEQETGETATVNQASESPAKSAGDIATSTPAPQSTNEQPKFNPFSSLTPAHSSAFGQASKAPFSFPTPNVTATKSTDAKPSPSTGLFQQAPTNTNATDADLEKTGQKSNNIFGFATPKQAEALRSPFKTANTAQNASSNLFGNPSKSANNSSPSKTPFSSNAFPPNAPTPPERASAKQVGPKEDRRYEPSSSKSGLSGSAFGATQQRINGAQDHYAEAIEYSGDDNPFDMNIHIPHPPEDFTDIEKLQFTTGWRLKYMDTGAQNWVEDHPDISLRDFQNFKRFYRLKVQAILAANGGSMMDLDPRTGQKRKASDEPMQDSPKRARLNSTQSSSLQITSFPSTTPASSPQKGPGLFPSSPSPSKRKAGESIARDQVEEQTTGKRARASPMKATVEPPPAAGSETSGMFQNILQSKSAASTPSASPSKASLAGGTTTASTAGSKHDADPKPFFQSVQSGAESSSKAAASHSFKVPSFGNSTDSTNFMSQFGQAATKNAEKEKEKRKADSFDSDEEDEAAWERRDAEEQRVKKQKHEEAAKSKARFVPGKGFVFEKTADTATGNPTDGEVSNFSLSVLDPQHPSHNSTSMHNIFGHLSDVDSGKEGSKTGDADDENEESDEDAEAEAEAAKSKQSSSSLFDRVTKDDKSASSSFSPAKATNVFGLPSSGSTLFGQSPKSTPATPASSEKDHTWKPSEPIKFGDSVNQNPSVNITSPSPSKAPPLASLFGTFNKTQPASESPSKGIGLAPSAAATTTTTGFGFGISPPKPISNSLAPPSNITSRATSPGLTTGESANESTGDAEDEGAEKHDQLNLTSGGPGEEDEDTLYEARAKASKWDESKKEWVLQGLGPFRIMKNRENGNSRMLMRQDPSGRILMNASLIPEVTYKAENKSMSRIPIMSESGKLETWIVKVGKDSDATTMAAKLEENKKN